MEKFLNADNSLDGYRPGQVVISKRGKDVGRTYVIVGFFESGRLALVDAERFNVSRPKPKNPRHVQATSRFISEAVGWASTGKDIDHGEFRRYINDSRKEKR